MNHFSLPDQLDQTLIRDQILKNNDPVLIACSGGPDSVALFHLFRRLKKQKFQLKLAHFNHGLRKSADRDEQFVCRLGEQYGVGVRTAKEYLKKTKSKKDSLEEACRARRYHFLIKAAKRSKINKVVLAHTQDDQAETVMMRILQGTGPRGLSAIRRVLKKEGVIFYRPLLDFPKKALLDYLKESGYPYRKDPTNRSIKFFRNRVRHQLLPLLARDYNPQIAKALGRIPEIAVQDEKALAFFEQESWKRTVRSSKSRICFNRKIWAGLPDSIQFRLLERALKKLDPASGLNFDLWRLVRQQLTKRKFAWSLPRRLELEGTREFLKVQEIR